MLELYVLDVVVEHLDLGHIVNQVVEIERLEGFGFRILNHSDCATGIYDQYAGTLATHRQIRFRLGL